MEMRIAFGHNLRFYREKNGMTQKQLADKIGYTEKSVSKWESGNGYPTLVTMTELCQVFGISLDALVYAGVSRYYLLGIDGGGTGTVFRLTDEDGSVCRTVTKGCSNPVDIGMEQAKKVLEDGIREICSGISCCRVTMYAGISGGGMSGKNAKILHDFFDGFRFYTFANGSDVENVMALVPQKPCILIIMGTGFIAYCMNGTQHKRIAGWGQLFDEGGSGYSIGRDAITATLRQIDGSGETTMLTAMLTERIGETPEQHLTRFYDGGKKYIAGFSDLVFTAALQGDGVAARILDDNISFVSQIIRTARQEFPEPVPVYFSGGVSKQHALLFPMLREKLGAPIELIPIQEEPVSGALKKASLLYQAKGGE